MQNSSKKIIVIVLNIIALVGNIGTIMLLGAINLLTKFSEDTYSEKLLFDQLAILLEYGEETKMTSVYLQEYGKIIINNNVFSQLRTYFK